MKISKEESVKFPKSCEHEFEFREQVTREISWHNWKKYDIFYCKKCLEIREVERQKEPESRHW